MTVQWKKNKLGKHRFNFFYKSVWFNKFINKMMLNGKKTAVERIVFFALRKLKVRHRKSGLNMLFLALLKNRPVVWFAPVRLGREIKKVPIPISRRRQLVIALGWFVRGLKLAHAEEKKGLPLQEFLFERFKAILYGQHTNLDKRYEDHILELVENRVNIHHRWKIKQ